MSEPDIEGFFRTEGVDLFSEVVIEEVPEPDRGYILSFLPDASSVIVFAKEIPAFVYSMSHKEKTREMLVIAESLDYAAKKLSKTLNEEGIPARPVPLYLPVTITDGKVRGLVRLKQVAAAAGLGTIGKSTLLITPDFGPRVFLDAVVTGRKKQDSKDKTVSGEVNICSDCGLCTKNCPGNAFGPDGIDAFRCTTIRTWVHPAFVPVVKWMLGRPMLLKIAAPFAPWIARHATMPCSRCVADCPKF